MDKRLIKEALQDILWEDYVLSDNYEDRYFLAKELSQKVPELTESRIYEAINYANYQVNPPRKTFRFIEEFLKKI